MSVLYTELEDDALFCHECGAKTGESPAEEPGEEMRKCSGCGAELNPEAKFCSHCGTPAAGQSPVRKSDKISRFSVDQIRVFTEKVIEKIKRKTEAVRNHRRGGSRRHRSAHNRQQPHRR